MSNHMHMIVKAKDGYKLSAIIRDFKKFTAQQIIKAIQEEAESRKDWLLSEMLKAGETNNKTQTYQLWLNDNHPIELYDNDVINQKIDYIHNNPVEEGIVEQPRDYLFCSARNFEGEIGLLQMDDL